MPIGDSEHIAGQVSPKDGHTIGDEVAARTETLVDAAIDAANGLHHLGGRKPRPEDFADILTDEGDSGGIFGEDINDPLIDIPDRGSMV